jgi:hypothetical protein
MTGREHSEDIQAPSPRVSDAETLLPQELPSDRLLALIRQHDRPSPSLYASPTASAAVPLMLTGIHCLFASLTSRGSALAHWEGTSYTTVIGHSILCTTRPRGFPVGLFRSVDVKPFEGARHGKEVSWTRFAIVLPLIPVDSCPSVEIHGPPLGRWLGRALPSPACRDSRQLYCTGLQVADACFAQFRGFYRSASSRRLLYTGGC